MSEAMFAYDRAQGVIGHPGSSGRGSGQDQTRSPRDFHIYFIFRRKQGILFITH